MSGKPGDSIRILVADDTTLVRRLLASQLAREAGFLVVGEAEDGRGAVEMTERLRPDVVIMDLNMPHLNGAQATERIVAQNPSVLVILLTAHEDLASLGRFTGAVDCLDKGCTPQELSAAIRRVYAARQATSAANAASAAANGTGGFGVGGGDGHENGGGGGAASQTATIGRIAARFALTERETSVIEKLVTTERTITQIAYDLSAGSGTKPTTESAVKHAMERALIKMGIEPRTRVALVKYVHAFERGNGRPAES